MKKKFGYGLKKKKPPTAGQREKPSSNGSMKKQYLKTRPSCKVTFRLPKDAVTDASKVTIAGEFNNWDTEAAQLKKIRGGDFSITIELEKDREYRFRYLIDNMRWENDWHADKYLPNAFGGDDSVVVV